MREILVEDHLKAAARALGGDAFKLSPASAVGLPDRIVVIPPGRVGFLELKRPGKEPTAVQFFWIRWLTARGIIARWVDSKSQVDAFLKELSE